MTRFLVEMNPKSVLDIGLGISSTLFSHYFNYHQFRNGNHMIIENDNQWVDFYIKNHSLSSFSKIILLECVKKKYNNYIYNAYNNFKNALEGKKFSVLSVDGPAAWDEPYKYSRRDILDIIPYALEDSFVIVMDDCNRKGEKATIADIETLLYKNHIEYYKGIYLGMTDCCVLTSADNKFFCTL